MREMERHIQQFQRTAQNLVAHATVWRVFMPVPKLDRGECYRDDVLWGPEAVYLNLYATIGVADWPSQPTPKSV
jgi:hypothetical protein